MANYIVKPLPTVQNGHTFNGDNFLRLTPHSPIFEGVTGLTFINCNLTNCDLPEDAVTVGCSPHHVNFCSHEHSHWLEHGLAECSETCSHNYLTDTVTIDGVVVDTVRHYRDEVVE